VLIDRGNETAPVLDRADPLTHNLPRTEAQKIAKHENLVLEIKYTWYLNNVSVYPFVITAEGVVTRNCLKYLQIIGLTKNIFRAGQKAVLLQTCHIACKFLGSEGWDEILLLHDEPNPTDNRGRWFLSR
jgi:hypothetical protein